MAGNDSGNQTLIADEPYDLSQPNQCIGYSPIFNRDGVKSFHGYQLDTKKQEDSGVEPTKCCGVVMDKGRCCCFLLRGETPNVCGCYCQGGFCVITDEIRILLWAILVLLAIGFFVVAMVSLFENSSITSTITTGTGVYIFIAGVSCVLATFLTIILIMAHRSNYYHPASQNHLIRILFMVPIYAWSGFAGLVFSVQMSLFFGLIRMCYEAFVIYTFVLLLTKYAGGHQGTLRVIMAKESHDWLFPLCCLPAVKSSEAFLWHLKRAAMQFVFCAPTIALIAFITECFDVYNDGELSLAHGYLYCVIIANINCIVAMYSLIWLYNILSEEIAVFKPLYKFFAVKGIVFWTFWQSVLLSAFVVFGFIPDAATAVFIQNFCICIEMLIFAMVHKYTFDFQSYLDPALLKLLQERNPSDIIHSIIKTTDSITNESSGNNAPGELKEPTVTSSVMDYLSPNFYGSSSTETPTPSEKKTKRQKPEQMI